MDLLVALNIVLIVNGIWDVCCVLCILFKLPILQFVHVSLWKNEEDSSNAAASHLMAYLISVWGGMRLAAGYRWCLECAWVSYLLEAAVFASETLVFERMHAGQGTAVAASSLFLGLCFYWAY